MGSDAMMYVNRNRYALVGVAPQRTDLLKGRRLRGMIEMWLDFTSATHPLRDE